MSNKHHLNEHNLRLERKIVNFDYDLNALKLSINFDSGITRVFLNVPQKVVQNFSTSIDKNRFYKENIEGSYCVK